MYQNHGVYHSFTGMLKHLLHHHPIAVTKLFKSRKQATPGSKTDEQRLSCTTNWNLDVKGPYYITTILCQLIMSEMERKSQEQHLCVSNPIFCVISVCVNCLHCIVTTM